MKEVRDAKQKAFHEAYVPDTSCQCCLESPRIPQSDYCAQCRQAIGVLYIQRSTDLQRQCAAEISLQHHVQRIERQRWKEEQEKWLEEIGAAPGVTVEQVMEVLREFFPCAPTDHSLDAFYKRHPDWIRPICDDLPEVSG